MSSNIFLHFLIGKGALIHHEPGKFTANEEDTAAHAYCADGQKTEKQCRPDRVGEEPIRSGRNR